MGTSSSEMEFDAARKIDRVMTCGCGRIGVGICVRCRVVLCERHAYDVDGQLRCQRHTPEAEAERDEAISAWKTAWLATVKDALRSVSNPTERSVRALITPYIGLFPQLGYDPQGLPSHTVVAWFLKRVKVPPEKDSCVVGHDKSFWSGSTPRRKDGWTGFEISERTSNRGFEYNVKVSIAIDGTLCSEEVLGPRETTPTFTAGGLWRIAELTGTKPFDVPKAPYDDIARFS